MLSLDVFRHEVNRNYIFVFQKNKRRKDERERQREIISISFTKKSEGKERNYLDL
jgi:uncharacterized protein YrzB (UPF0473 family)